MDFFMIVSLLGGLALFLYGMSMLGSGLEWTRVEARGELTGRRNIVHVITRERAGQLRGVPVLAPVLEALKQLGRYTEAEITAWYNKHKK